MTALGDILHVVPGPLHAGQPGWTLERLRDALLPSSGRRSCSGPALQGVLAAAVDQVGPGPFGAVAGTPGFLRALESLLDELALGSVPPAALGEAAERLGPPGRRLLHLGRMVETCLARLLSAQAELPAARWTPATAALARGWPEWLQARRLEVEVAPPCPPAVVAFLGALARATAGSGRALAIHVPLCGDAEMDAALEPLLRAFEGGPDLPGVELLPRLAEGPLSEQVRRQASAERGTLPSGALEALVAPGTGRQTAALIHALRQALEAGAPPDRCTLAVLRPEEATELVQALCDAGLPCGRRPPAALGTTAAGRVGLLWAGLVTRRAPAEEVAWLLRQRLLPALRTRSRRDPLPLLRRAGLRDAALGAEARADAYRVRLSAFAARRRAAGEVGEADAAERLLEEASALLRLAERIPERGRLPELLEAWRAGLESAGFWSALEREPLEPDARDRMAAAREAAAVETWRAFVRDVRSGWKAAGPPQAVVGRAELARWLADSAAHLPVHLGPGAPGGIDVLPLEELPGRPLAFVGIAGLDAASFPRRGEPPLLSEEEREAIHAVLGRVALPAWIGGGEAGGTPGEALDRWRLGQVLSSAERVCIGRRAGAGGAPADPVARLLAVSGAVERDLGREALPLLEEAPGPRWARARLALEASVAPELRDAASDLLAAAALDLLGPAPWLDEARALAAVEAERLRARAGLASPGTHSGSLGSEELVARVAARLGGSAEGPLSSTSLSALANCPFQGLARKVLALEPPEDVGEELDPRGRGQFLHAALERLVARLLELGLVDADPADLPQDLVPAAVEAAATAHAERFPTGHPRLWALAQARARRTLERLIRSGRLFPFSGLRPAEAEVPFGPDLELPPALPGEQPIFCRGTLDRIDRGPGGTGVLDYKSSKRRDRARAELLVTDFQLPLYLLALRARGERPPFHAGWLSLRTLEFLPLDPDRTGPLDTFLATDAATRTASGAPNLATTLHALLAEPRQGVFPVRPRDCGFCTFAPVCRISERRAPQAVEG